MTVTLNLKPEVEERIVAEAKARGLSVETYILNLLEKEATNGEASFALTATPEEWKTAFLEWVHTERPAHTHRYQMKRSAAKAFIAREKMLSCDLCSRHQRTALISATLLS